MKRILGIAGSPRPGGNTEFLLERLLAAAEAEGAETKMFTLAGKTIAPCADCGRCTNRQPYCVQSDDMQALYDHMLWADAIVFGTPVYMGTMTAQLKAVFDRARPLWLMDNALSRKIAAAVAVGEGRWGGQELAIQNVYWAALNHGMVVVGGACLPYGNWEVCGVAGAAGQIAADEEAIAAAEGLGRRLAKTNIEFG
jgi:multimeric flavodoxin WrbA